MNFVSLAHMLKMKNMQLKFKILIMKSKLLESN